MSDALAQKLAQVRAPSLSDAVRKLYPHRHHVLGLVTPTPGRVLFGQAATMLFAPSRADVPKERQDFERHLRAAVGDAPRGKVLVCAAPGAEESAVAGGVRLALVEALGLAGLLTSARLRDFDEARGYAFAAYCGGETPMAGSAQSMPVATGVPVALGGATVLPEDYVYASEAGAVVIPGQDLHRVLDLALDVEREDAARVAKARKARP
ncbi:MAG TPA: RraA family protein [Candidatus Thermoplasmatota archaeon]|nr:RraA family protein [Candidatus Thermoplasmatota archaeon]